jgi:hypothetical protein
LPTRPVARRHFFPDFHIRGGIARPGIGAFGFADHAERDGETKPPSDAWQFAPLTASSAKNQFSGAGGSWTYIDFKYSAFQ